MNPEELVKKIDPNLKYQHTFEGTTLLVCKVLQEGLPRIIKLANVKDNWRVEHANREIKALNIAKNFSRINKLIRVYPNTKNYCGIMLKEYIEGKTLSEQICEVAYQKRLEKIIDNLHCMGMADLDIGRNNLLISTNKEIRLIELGNVQFSDEISIEDFEYLKQQDKKEMYRIFR